MQIGHKSAYEYGCLAAEAGKTMKLVDPSIELIACGSSLSNMETYPMWDMEVLEQTYDVIDYLACTSTMGDRKKVQSVFSQTLDMEEYIKTVRSAAR